MSIQILIRAAEYIEKKDRAAADEHGYACILPPSPPPSVKILSRSAPIQQQQQQQHHNGHHHLLHSKPSKTRRKKSVKLKRSSSSKGSHNELEKNRRAHLRECLDQLKKVVPLSPESSRHTTLGLLINTVNLIKSLEEESRQQDATMSMLSRERQFLLWNLSQGGKRPRYRSTGHHTVSESSSSGSLDGSPFGSENDEVDIIGCHSPSSPSSSSSSLCTTPVQPDSGSISPVSVAMTTINQSFNSLL